VNRYEKLAFSLNTVLCASTTAALRSYTMFQVQILLNNVQNKTVQYPRFSSTSLKYLLVSSCPSWLQTSSSMMSMFSCVCTEQRRPSPEACSAVLSIFLIRSLLVLFFYCIDKISLITRKAFHLFSYLKHLIKHLPSAIKCAMLVVKWWTLGLYKLVYIMHI